MPVERRQIEPQPIYFHVFRWEDYEQRLVEQCMAEVAEDQRLRDVERRLELQNEMPCPMRVAQVDFAIAQDWDAYRCEFTITS